MYSPANWVIYFLSPVVHSETKLISELFFIYRCESLAERSPLGKSFRMLFAFSAIPFRWRNILISLFRFPRTASRFLSCFSPLKILLVELTKRNFDRWRDWAYWRWERNENFIINIETNWYLWGGKWPAGLRFWFLLTRKTASSAYLRLGIDKAAHDSR